MSKGRILIVDDEPTALELLEFLLGHHGFEVIAATDAEIGLQKAAQTTPDVAILDVMMPRMTGIDMCRQMRRDPKLRAVPVLFLSALGQEVEVMRGLQAGGEGYIIKPFDPQDLIRRVEELLKKIKEGGTKT